MIDIYSISGEVLASVPISSEAVIHEELMASDYIKLSWNAESNEELPAGSYIEYNGERYSLLAPYRPSPSNEVYYEYEPEFQSRVMLWDRMPACIYAYKEDGITIKSREFEWDFVGAPADALFAIKQAIYNETGETWDYELAEGLPASINLNVSNNTIFGALSSIAEACETEWWADKSKNVFHLAKCERFANMPLEVGVHVGKPTISSNSENYYSRFYALGSSRNIVDDTPLSGSIAQPVNRRLTLNPIKYPNGYKDIAGHFEDGVYVSDLQQGEVFSTTLVFEEVFPSSKLEIESVRKRLKYRLKDDEKIELGKDENGNPIYEQYAIWYFKIKDFVFSEDLIIKGQTLSVNFKSGKLAGREFELAYHKYRSVIEHKYDDVEDFQVLEGDYEIIIDESTGSILPSVDYLIPEKGDKIVLFNINMPEEYVDSSQDELEAELDKEIAKRLADNNNYEFESYPYAFQQNALSLELGRNVLFKFGGYELHTRVLMVETQLDCEYQQKIKLGNQMVKGSRQELREEVRNVGEEVAAMKQQEKILISLQRDYADSLRNTISNYLALQDTIGLLQGAFKGFSEGANPITVETMLVMLGDNSLQYRIVDNLTNLAPLTNPITYDSASRHLSVVKSSIVHYTLDINDIQPSSSRDISQYLKWDMLPFTSGVLNDESVAYYLYARVPHGGGEGDYKLVAGKIDLDAEKGYYHLLVGILNKEYSGTREFVRMYGFTSVGAGQISTDVIKSSDGGTTINLLTGEIKGNISFTAPDGSVKAMTEFAEEQSAQFSKVDKNVQNLQGQIDGVVENHFYAKEPSLTSEPTSLWVTDEQKINHIGDTYTDIEDFVDSVTTPNSGKSWRWCRCDDMVGIEDYVEATDKDGVKYKLHWHPIADTDAVKALLKTYELEKRVDDAEYLKNTFNKLEEGSTEISGGVVMSNVVAVKDTDGNIEAFLNGSSEVFANNGDLGKLILAAGIPKVTENNSSDIEKRAKEAETRIYENGTVVFNTGQIGGNWAIDKDFGLVHSENCNDKQEYSNLNGAHFYSEKHPSSTLTQKVLIGRGAFNNFPETLYRNTTAVVIESNEESMFTVAKHVALLVSAKGVRSKENYAIEAVSGQFAGLRPLTRVVKSLGSSADRTNVTNLDHTILFDITTDGAYAYVALPSDAEVGQEIEFLGLDKDLGFNITASHPIYNMYGGTTIAVGSSATYAYGSQRRHIKFFFTGEKWVMVHWNFGD